MAKPKMPRVCDYCGESCGPVSEVRGTRDDWNFDGSYYHARCLPEAPRPEGPRPASILSRIADTARQWINP